MAQDGNTVVEADFLGDEAVLDLEDRGAGEAHGFAGVEGGQAAEREVGHGRAGVGAAADPLADDVVAFGDEVGGAFEAEVGEGASEGVGEFADGVAVLRQLGLIAEA